MQHSRKKSLKIAMVISSNPESLGGVQEHLFYLIRELTALGHQVHLFGPEHKKALWIFDNYTAISKSKEIFLPNGNWSSYTRATSHFGYTLQMITKHFDVVHIHEPYEPFTSWQAIKTLKIPKVTSFHTAWSNKSVIAPIKSVLPLFKTIFSNNVAAVIYISEHSQSCWSNLCASNVLQKVIPYGIDKTSFIPKINKKTVATKKIQLLFLGRLVPRKGLHLLLLALVLVKIKTVNFNLTVVGDGKQRRELEAQTIKLGLQKHVTFVGKVLGKKKIRFYQKSDVFCAPYTDEGFALTVLEAMACGCSIVGFYNDAFSETLAAYPAPELLCDYPNVDQLAAALLKICTDHELRAKLKKWCSMRSESFSWQKVASKTEHVYYKVIG